MKARDVNLNGNFSLAQKPHEPEDGRDTPRAAGWHKAADNARIGNDTTTQPQAPERTNRERSGSTGGGVRVRAGTGPTTYRLTRGPSPPTPETSLVLSFFRPQRPESREGRRTRRRAQTELLVDPTKLPPPAQTGHRRESGDARPHPALACGRKVRQNSRPGATATPRRQSRPAPGRGRASARLAAARPPPPPLARSAENEGTVISKRTPGGARQPPSNDRLHRAAVPRIGARRPALSSGDTEHGNKSPHSPPPRTEWHNLGQDLQPGPLCDLTNDTRATRDLDRDRAAAAAAAAASDQSETRNQDEIRPNGAARTREPGSWDRSQAGRGGKDGRPAPREKTNRPPARPPPPVARPPPPPNMARKGQMETRKRKKKKKKNSQRWVGSSKRRAVGRHPAHL
ncbi:serine/arginine repetitive matrix protein 1-like [Dipodomys spectabilis]|uniref:serine/arginine repetitive matrix protein 1-like n=1 Tax=Dipodomys spectabilis TaxID=105255 RepID=UPI001C53BFE7|nr:serine/arginine repetitive matrix protein 1-like [Dipodomys spectabilis]